MKDGYKKSINIKMNIANIPSVCMYNILSYLTPKPKLLKEIKEFLPKRELIKIFNDRLNTVYKCTDSYSLYDDINMNMNFILSYYLTSKIWKTCKTQWEYENIIDVELLMNKSNEYLHPYKVIIELLDKLSYNNIKELLLFFDKNVIRRWIRMYKIKKGDIFNPPYYWMYEGGNLMKKYSKIIDGCNLY